MAPDSEPVGRRTHPATGLIQGALWAAGAAVALVSSIGSRDVLWSALSIPAGLVIGMGFGFLQWRFTRFVIDGQELRINSGILTKNSRRIPYERLQSVDISEPFVARLFGLAELRIEMAGGEKSRTSLRFLTLHDATELRHVLLGRANAEGGPSLDPDGVPQPEDVIATVPPERIMVGTLLSLDFAAAVVSAAVLITVGLLFSQVAAVIGGVIPTVFWLMQIVGTRVIAQWGFTLTRTGRGVRIERGLLSRSSQTVPIDRVQGIAVVEPFIWRRFGWQRLEVDVAGYASTGEDSDNAASSTLLPISDDRLARAVTAELMPGSELETSGLARAPRRSRWFAPVGWRYRHIDATESTIVTTTGWIERSRNMVPHHKTQSVSVRQGPLQRRLGLATFDVHTPKGPVDAQGRNFDGTDARREAFAQLARARQARSLHT